MRAKAGLVLTALACAGALLLAPSTTGTAAAADVTCDGKVATIVAVTSPTYPIVPTQGTPGDDVIVGTDGDDVILGLGGNDTICGLAGADRIEGGEGDDRLFGGLDGEYVADDGYYGDQVVPGPGNDVVDLGHDPVSTSIHWVDTGYWDAVSFEGAPGPVSVDLAAGTATGEGTDTIVVPVATGGASGSAYDDVLVGSGVDDYLLGGGGDDRIEGGAGDDKIHPDELLGRIYRGPVSAQDGVDRVTGGPGRDSISSVRGADRLFGDEDRDYIYAREARLVDAGAGPDYVHAWGDATVRGAAGKDDLWFGVRLGMQGVIKGGAGKDILTLDIPPKVARRGTAFRIDQRRSLVAAGSKRLLRVRDTEGYAFNAVQALRLTFVGGAGPDRLEAYNMMSVRAFGRGGADDMVGGPGNDLLDGGPGRDKLRGHGGRDRCLRGERVSQCELRR